MKTNTGIFFSTVSTLSHIVIQSTSIWFLVELQAQSTKRISFFHFPITVAFSVIIQWCPIKMRVFHQNESCLSCLHPPSSCEGRREQGRQLSFWWKTLNLIGHYGIVSLGFILWKLQNKALEIRWKLNFHLTTTN